MLHLRIMLLRTIFSVGVFALAPQLFAGISSTDDTSVRFNRDIRPILSDRCFACHGPDSAARKADMRLDLPGQADEVLSVGNAEKSELLRRVSSEDPASRMPPPGSHKKPLTDQEIELLARWIESGAEHEAHWSLIPPQRPSLPKGLEQDAWCRHPIDRFVLQKLEQEGITPSGEADDVALVRRLYFDLIGLPPTAEEVDAFLLDNRPDAYERLVDDLLDSPHFGERMAMYWLDLVRYADTVGYHGDQDHSISPYRDWVIHAFNTNMPFAEFTRKQLAGDLLPNATTSDKIASGYNRVLQTSHEGGIQQKEYQAKYDADRVRNISAVWMGATLGCAECHDHKYDPYTQRDFYEMAAFFADVDDSRTFQGDNALPTKREPEIRVQTELDQIRIAEQAAKVERLREALASLEGESQQAAAEDLELAEVILKEMRASKRRTMITESVEPRTIRVLPRGDWMDDSGPVVQPGVPEFVLPLDVLEGPATRLDLANWLTSPEHPQTSRVFVNRLWYLFFGNGISATLDDVGAQSEWPSHPDLLDWLAVEFIESGWDIKHVIRQIVLSSTYRQSSYSRPELKTRDPENRLLARQSRWRLPAEMIRDQALAIGGLLSDEVGGRSVRPYQPAGYYAHLNFPERKYVHDRDWRQYRRGVYVHWQRQFLHPMLKAFDAPSREECTAQRPRSNTPLAALTLLNDPTMVEAARSFAARVMNSSGGEEAKSRWAWKQVLGREPEKKEADALIELYRSQRDYYQQHNDEAEQLLQVGMAPRQEELAPVELAAWTSVSRALLNLSETITRR